jgi:hypothetical protein
MGGIKAAEPPESRGLSLRYAAFMQGLREAIDARIRLSRQRQTRDRYRIADRPSRWDRCAGTGVMPLC